MSSEAPQREWMARTDLLTAVVLLVLGLAMLYGGLAMDRLEIRRIHPLSIPGLVPIALGAALSVCAAMLFWGGVKRGGLQARLVASDRGAALRLALCLALCLVYPLVLVGWLPFSQATGLFVFAFIATFEWERRSPLAHLRAMAMAAVQGAIVGVVTAYVFQELFLVRLP